jgi:hypothetical protein
LTILAKLADERGFKILFEDHRWGRPKVSFASDSALEGAGFEISVPRKTPGVLAGVGSRSRRLSLVGGKSGRGSIRRS